MKYREVQKWVSPKTAKINAIFCFDTMKIYHVRDVNLALHLNDTRTINGLTVYFLSIKV